MKRREVVTGGFTTALLAGCGAAEPAWTLRFRVSIDLLSDGAIQRGSSAFRAVYTRNPESMLNRPSEFRTRVWGEAPIIDLGEGGLLFGVLSSINGVEGPYFDPGREHTLTSLLPPELRTPDNILSGRLYDVLGDMRDELVVPPERWPTFVHFTDLADKSTARLVIPAGQDYELSPNTPRQPMAAFGARVAGVAVEMTDAEPRREIERVLPWIGELPGARRGLHYEGGPQQPLGERRLYRHFKMEGYAR